VERNEKFAKISEVQVKYADMLMSKANVVGIGVGLKQRAGEASEDMALVVMVSQKVALMDLAESDQIPAELDDVLLDVQVTGAFSTM